MQEKFSFIPYIIGIVIGFTMLMSFVFGYQLLFSNNPAIGSLLISLALFLYPSYIIFVLLLSWLNKEKWSIQTKKHWRMSIIVVPGGAIIAIITIAIASLF